jgi:hypothetical protein
MAALSAAAPSSYAQDETALDRTPVSCITISRVRHMAVIDTQTLVFRMNNGQVYRNRLHQVCPNIDLASNAIEYPITSSRLPRLCADDVVTTREMITCRLGPFEPITADEADALEEGADAAPEAPR